MKKIEKIDDVYPAIDELIRIFARQNQSRLSDILYHRMYKVSWTSRDELLEELSNVMKKIIKNDRDDIDELVVQQIENIVMFIDSVLGETSLPGE